MAAEEDNFDIDIYGDGGEDYQQIAFEEANTNIENPPEPATNHTEPESGGIANPEITQLTINGPASTVDVTQRIVSTDDSAQDSLRFPKQAPQTQGLMRKDGSDDRYLEPGATSALFISELHWWITDDDIRGWANQSQCEDELEDVTFSEHKVNGKSKG